MINLIDEVGNALKADTALTSLINKRVHYIRPPTPTTFPYITFFEVSNSETESSDDEEYADDIEIQVDIWQKEGSTIPIAKEVQRVLRKLGFVHNAMPDMYESDTKIFHKAIRFSIIKEV
jgi:hypothetical protein